MMGGGGGGMPKKQADVESLHGLDRVGRWTEDRNIKKLVSKSRTKKAGGRRSRGLSKGLSIQGGRDRKSRGE